MKKLTTLLTVACLGLWIVGCSQAENGGEEKAPEGEAAAPATPGAEGEMEGEGEAAPEGEGEAAPEGEGEAAPEGEKAE